MSFLLLFFCSENLFAQFRHGDRKNIVKMNLSSLVIRNIQIHSEHLLTERISLGIGVRYMPTGSIPFATRLASSDTEISLEELDKISPDNYAVSPEIRWYFGNRGLGRRFYLATFFQIARYGVQYGDFEISFVRADDGEKFNRNMDIDGRLLSG